MQAPNIVWTLHAACLQVRAAEEELTSVKQAADARASEGRGAERARAAAQADKALLAAQLATQRRKAAAAAEAADTAAIERGLLQRGAEEAQEAVQRLAASKAGAAAAKASAQVGGTVEGEGWRPKSRGPMGCTWRKQG